MQVARSGEGARVRLLEVCVDSVSGAVRAQQGGAGRVELCASLVEGGTTPSVGLMRAVVRAVRVPVMVMVRPRGGDFLFSEEEVQVMELDVAAAKQAGAAGVVVGALTREGRVDEAVLRRLCAAAAPLQVCFHRAIDVSRDPLEVLRTLAALGGVHRVLTSGGAASALAGHATVRAMVELAEPLGITVMAGAGVDEVTCADVARLTHATELHGSLRCTEGSAMLFRKDPPIFMGAEKRNEPAAEFTIKVVDASRVAAVCLTLGLGPRAPPAPPG